ncbi:MAG: hydantoinase/oxoprolinase family protein [Gemmatimonadota bacterium]
MNPVTSAVPTHGTVGWDIGGVNTKVARIAEGGGIVARSRPFEIQRVPESLADLLRSLAAEVGTVPGDRHAVTMTAELSQLFRTKAEGVTTILDAVEAAFPGVDIRVFTVDGRFLTVIAARSEPMAVAASNWAATAMLVARSHPDCILVDIGTTTTDLIPIAGGRIIARGTTDLERLRESELLYTGAVRTPLEAIASEVPVEEDRAGVAAEGFALVGDVHLWLGKLAARDYSVAAPDGRPATVEFAGERIRRAVCADRTMLSDAAVERIARFLADAQLDRIAAALRKIAGRESITQAVVTGIGEFIATAAAQRAGLAVTRLADQIGDAAARTAPAAAVAILGSEYSIEHPEAAPRTRIGAASVGVGSSDGNDLTVIKIGGGLSAIPGALDRIGTALSAAGQVARLVVLPGGGPFAEAVREFDERIGLTSDAAHWMAILGMDQYAHALAVHIPGAVVVEDAAGIHAALEGGAIPVLAPARWLRAADELPHQWDVTSDSLSAYLAGLLGATRMILIKPVSGTVDALVDPWFPRAVPDGMRADVLGESEIEQLIEMLRR